VGFLVAKVPLGQVFPRVGYFGFFCVSVIPGQEICVFSERFTWARGPTHPPVQCSTHPKSAWYKEWQCINTVFGL
jgi:hypothetical protein